MLPSWMAALLLSSALEASGCLDQLVARQHICSGLLHAVHTLPVYALSCCPNQSRRTGRYISTAH